MADSHQDDGSTAAAAAQQDQTPIDPALQAIRAENRKRIEDFEAAFFMEVFYG